MGVMHLIKTITFSHDSCALVKFFSFGMVSFGFKDTFQQCLHLPNAEQWLNDLLPCLVFKVID